MHSPSPPPDPDAARTQARSSPTWVSIGALAGAALCAWLLSHAPPRDDVELPAPTEDPRVAVASDVVMNKAERADPARFASAMTAHRDVAFAGDLDAIRQRGVLRLLTRNGPSSWYLLRGEQRGFDFEVARLLADELGVRLEVVIPPRRDALVPWLIAGRGDVVLADLGPEDVDDELQDDVRLSLPVDASAPVLVVPASLPHVDDEASWRTLRVVVRAGAPSLQTRLHGNGVHDVVEAAADLEDEDLLDEVAAGRAAACAIAGRAAAIELPHRRDVVRATVLEPRIAAAFAMRATSTLLREAVDAFVRKHLDDGRFAELRRRHLDDRTRTRAAVTESLRADRDGRLTPLDDAFIAAGASVGIDWRLLVALAMQESRLDGAAQSRFGAAGVMQLLPTTAQALGCGPLDDARENILCGARYLASMMRQVKAWADHDAELPLVEQVRLALAAYNAGPGHLDDARRLAVAQGLDPDRWFGHVATTIVLLSKPRFAKEAAAGYCDGDETARFVDEIQARYETYAATVDVTPPAAAPSRPTKKSAKKSTKAPSRAPVAHR